MTLKVSQPLKSKFSRIKAEVIMVAADAPTSYTLFLLSQTLHVASVNVLQTLRKNIKYEG